MVGPKSTWELSPGPEACEALAPLGLGLASSCRRSGQYCPMTCSMDHGQSPFLHSLCEPKNMASLLTSTWVKKLPKFIGHDRSQFSGESAQSVIHILF